MRKCECGEEIDLDADAYYPYGEVDEVGNYKNQDLCDVPFCSDCADRITTHLESRNVKK